MEEQNYKSAHANRQVSACLFALDIIFILILVVFIKFQIVSINGVAESWDDFTQFGTNFQWFQTPIHPAFIMQSPINF